ncbi:hypothetical protein FACS1894137_05490 [Spirochaetia bacterium]|nr:hypothetical protein FACS1894137_05490 [Spirochaetia bacterium]
MAFCVNCGTSLDEGTKFCPKCGTKIDAIPTGAQPVYQQPTSPFSSGGTEKTKGKESHAIVSLVLGLCGLIAWIIPLIGFPVTILGLIFGVFGYKTTRKNMAVAGLVLSIICLVATIVNSAIGSYQGATGTGWWQ